MGKYLRTTAADIGSGRSNLWKELGEPIFKIAIAVEKNW